VKVLWRICYRFNRIIALRLALRALDVLRAGDTARARRLTDRAEMHRTRAEKFCALIKGRA
jgi:hypothetical protein